MTAAKTPPERITVFSPDGYPSDLSWDECVDGDKPREYILASVVEKRELALREALRAMLAGTRDYAARGMGERLPVEYEMPPSTAKRVRALIVAALAAADEGEAKPCRPTSRS